MTVVVKLSAEYFCFPTWRRDADGFYEDMSPVRIPLSAALSKDVMTWSDTYQQTYADSDPAASGFADLEQVDEFVTEGRKLAERI